MAIVNADNGPVGAVWLAGLNTRFLAAPVDAGVDAPEDSPSDSMATDPTSDEGGDGESVDAAVD